MENKQTAVQWLMMQLPVFIRVDLYEKELYHQAKAMEEDQIIASWENGFWEGCEDKFSENCGLQYYNQTYGTPVDKKG